tara:strand:+ start:540 stop:1103 length:564 start_codon:yes stop_codon:yes gene_type:complete
MENIVSGSTSDNKNFIISTLVFLLILSFLGINILQIVGNLMETLIKIFGPLITQILSIFGYTAGTVIDKTAVIATDVATAGIEIAGDSVQTVGTLLKDVSRKNVDLDARLELDNSLNRQENSSYPNDDYSENPIQKPITSNKTNWCLVGEYQGKRGCIEVDNSEQCLSNQVYPSQKLCLNPTLTSNM